MNDHDRNDAVRRSGRARSLLITGSAAASVAFASTLAFTAHAVEPGSTVASRTTDGSTTTSGTSAGLVGTGTSTASHAKSSGS